MTSVTDARSGPDASTEQIVTGNWIDGQWSRTGTVEESRSPATGKVLGRFYSAGATEAAAAIAAARTSFDTTSWSRDAAARAKALNELADRLEPRAQEIALTLARDNGKLVGETIWEVSTTAEWLRYSAATALTQNAGTAAEASSGMYFHTHVEPMGVAGIITPWNSPVILSSRSIGPALAAGCTVVVKMPGQTGLANALFADVIASTKSLPPGVVNIFTEVGNEGAPLLVESPDVDVISYTGSTQVGRAIAAAGAKTLKRMSLELGGKTPLVVFEDANLDVVLPQLLQAVIMMNGQFCVTGSRVLVHRSIADEVRKQLIAALSAVRVGSNEDPTSDLGPLVDKASVDRVDQMVREAGSYAKYLVRGGPVRDGELEHGAYYAPTLLEVDDVNVPVIQQELFGPVQSFEVFDDEADAIRRVNATQFGLAASVFTTDEGRARRVGREIKAGIIWTNAWALLSEQFEQGGYKQSGYGHLCGPRAIQEFQHLKTYGQMAPPAS